MFPICHKIILAFLRVLYNNFLKLNWYVALGVHVELLGYKDVSTTNDIHTSSKPGIHVKSPLDG